MKTAKVSLTIEAEVPVAVCAKCGASENFHIHALNGSVRDHQHGQMTFQLTVPPNYIPFLFGERSLLICTGCVSFVSGALDAMGLLAPPG